MLFLFSPTFFCFRAPFPCDRRCVVIFEVFCVSCFFCCDCSVCFLCVCGVGVSSLFVSCFFWGGGL